MKLVFTGCVGAGKTEAVQAVSEIPVISTEVKPSDEVQFQKESTTIAMDYGELRLNKESKLELYGTPGQSRFSFMWDILSKGAMGIIVLLNHQRPNPIEDLEIYQENFSTHIENSALAIGVTHLDSNQSVMQQMRPYYDHLMARDMTVPILPVDARKRSDVIILLQSLVLYIEAKT